MVRLLVSIVLSFLVTACANDEETGDCGDCPPGEVCIDGQCRWPCVTPADCPAVLNRCWDGTCIFSDSECERDSHCTNPAMCHAAAGAACTDNLCTYPPAVAGLPCDDDYPCTTGDACDGQGSCSGTPVVCDQPEPDACVTEDNTEWFVTHATPGTCDPADGTCDYQEARVECPDCLAECLGVCDTVTCPPLEGGCRTNGYCNPLTADCEYTDLDDGAACDLEGTDDGHCLDAACRTCAFDAHCDDANPCTTNTCSTAGDCSTSDRDGEACGSPSCAGLEWRAPVCVTDTCDDTVTDCDAASVGTLDSCDPDLGCAANGGLLLNPSFESGTDSWTFITNEADASFSTGAGLDGDLAANLEFTAINGATNVQLWQNDISLAAETELVLAFAARSSSGADMEVHLAQHLPPNDVYGLHFAPVDVREAWAWRYFRFTSENSTAVSDARLLFWFPPFASGGDVYDIDTVILTPASEVESLEMVNLLANPGCEDGAVEWGSLTTLTTSPTAHSGDSSCVVTNRSEVWEGLRQTLTGVLDDGTTYDVSAWMRIEGATSGTARITLRVDDSEGYRFQSTAEGTAVSSSGWTEVRGTLTPDIRSGVTAVRLYTETEPGHVDVFVDDFVVSPRL